MLRNIEKLLEYCFPFAVKSVLQTKLSLSPWSQQYFHICILIRHSVYIPSGGAKVPMLLMLQYQTLGIWILRQTTKNTLLTMCCLKRKFRKNMKDIKNSSFVFGSTGQFIDELIVATKTRCDIAGDTLPMFKFMFTCARCKHSWDQFY